MNTISSRTISAACIVFWNMPAKSSTQALYLATFMILDVSRANCATPVIRMRCWLLCVLYVCVEHVYYTCNTCAWCTPLLHVGYTPVLQIWKICTRGVLHIYDMFVCRSHDTARSLAHPVFISKPTDNTYPLAKSRPTVKIQTHC